MDDSNNDSSGSDASRSSPHRSLVTALLNTQLRHIGAILVIVTICASVFIETLATGQIPPQRVRRLILLAGGLFGIARGLDLLNQLLNALNDP